MAKFLIVSGDYRRVLPGLNCKLSDLKGHYFSVECFGLVYRQRHPDRYFNPEQNAVFDAMSDDEALVIFNDPTNNKKLVSTLVQVPEDVHWADLYNDTVANYTRPAVEDPDGFPVTLGIELTRMYPVKMRDISLDGRLANSYADIVGAFLMENRYTVHSCRKDAESVEISSKPLRTMAEVEKFYTMVTGITDNLGLVASVQHSISGGGHIHVGGLSGAEIAVCYRFVQNNPWLAWTMNDPDDRRTAMSLITQINEIKKNVIDAVRAVNAPLPALICAPTSGAMRAAVYFGNPEIFKDLEFEDDKTYAVRHCQRYKTLEFRFFEAAHTWAEQKSHVNLVLAIVNFAKETVKNKTWFDVSCYGAKYDAAKLVSYEELAHHFRETINFLALDPTVYEPLLTANLKVRKERGNLV